MDETFSFARGSRLDELCTALQLTTGTPRVHARGQRCFACQTDLLPLLGRRRNDHAWPLVSGFPVYRPGRVDQESKIEAMRRYGGDLQNILRKRSQVFG